MNLDLIKGVFYRFAASGYLTPAWFRSVDPATVNRASKKGLLHLEIVSHCWQYSHFLVYQLSSLVKYRTDELKITFTVYYAAEDRAVVEVLEYFQAISVPGVTWNWREMPKESLFRRSIGRNLAAKASSADWVWFTDCDIIFHENCLQSLASELQGRDDILVFPRIGLGTTLLTDDSDIIKQGHGEPALLDIPLNEFVPYGHARTKAQGPYQITHGDVARACGYCENIGHYQTPANRWQKAYEDRAFRWLLGTQGVAIDVDGACQIRHLSKGRYKEKSLISKLRMFIRQSNE